MNSTAPLQPLNYGKQGLFQPGMAAYGVYTRAQMPILFMSGNRRKNET